MVVLGTRRYSHVKTLVNIPSSEVEQSNVFFNLRTPRSRDDVGYEALFPFNGRHRTTLAVVRSLSEIALRTNASVGRHL